MNTVIKEKIRSIKDEIKTLHLKKESLLDKVNMQKDFIEQLENRGKEEIKNKKTTIETLNHEIDVFMRECGTLEEVIFEKQKEIKEYVGSTERLKKYGNLKGKLSQKFSTIEKDYEFFNENTVCPTCTQVIKDEFRLNKIQESQDKIQELKSAIDELKKTIQEEEFREEQFLILSKEITNLNNEISQNNIKILNCQKRIKESESEIKTIQSQIENKNTEHEKLEQFKASLSNTLDELESSKDSINHYDFLYTLLKDGGVKTKIIKKYLPFINQQVNRYLQIMDFYINFVLDEEFNEKIQSPIHDNFSYSSFSEGEKARINLALIFAWRELAKFKNSVNCNLILFDEVFDSSLDEAGSDDFLKIIRYVLTDTNVFVISHKTGLDDKFESVYNVEKIKGFSKITKNIIE